MKSFCFTLTFLAATAFAGEVSDKRLIGIWKSVAIIEAGKRRPYPNVGAVFFEYHQNGSVTITTILLGRKTSTPWRFTADASKSPAIIDRTNSDGDLTTKGIYRFAENGELEELFDREWVRGPRPTSFPPSPIEGLLILKMVDKIQ